MTGVADDFPAVYVISNAMNSAPKSSWTAHIIRLAIALVCVLVGAVGGELLVGEVPGAIAGAVAGALIAIACLTRTFGWVGWCILLGSALGAPIGMVLAHIGKGALGGSLVGAVVGFVAGIAAEQRK
jgi:hypothetical protein